MRYIREYDDFMSSSPWYYRLTRYFINDLLLKKPNFKQMVPIDEAIYLAEQELTLTALAKHNNRFVNWVLGLNLLIDKIIDIKEHAIDDIQKINSQVADIQKMDFKTELGELKSNAVVKQVSNSSGDFLNLHLKEKVALVKEVAAKTRYSYKIMPTSFERFGRNKEITAAPVRTVGKLMTYRNLIIEKKATFEEQQRAANRMAEKREQGCGQEYFFYNSLFQPGRTEILYLKKPYNSKNDPGKCEGNIVDGCISTIGYLNRELEKIRSNAPYVKLGEDLELEISYQKATPKL